MEQGTILHSTVSYPVNHIVLHLEIPTGVNLWEVKRNTLKLLLDTLLKLTKYQEMQERLQLPWASILWSPKGVHLLMGVKFHIQTECA